MVSWNHKEPPPAVDLTHYKTKYVPMPEHTPVGPINVINLPYRQSGGWQAWAKLALLIREETRGRVWCIGHEFNPYRRGAGVRLWDSYNDCAFVIYNRAEWADWRRENGWGGHDAA